MLKQLRLLFGDEHRSDFTQYLIWASVYGVLQGLSISFLMPIAQSLAAQNYPAVWRWTLCLAIAALVCSIAHYVQAMKSYALAVTLLRTMHLRIGDHLVTLPIGWFSGKTGSVSQIAAKGTISIGGAAAHIMTPLVTGITGPATVTVLMFFFDWRLGLVLLFSAPLIVVGFKIGTHFIAQSDQAVHAATDETSDRVIEFAQCQPVLRAFGRSRGGQYQPLADAITAQQKAVKNSMVQSVVGLSLNNVAVQAVFTIFVVAVAVLAGVGSVTGIEVVALLGIATRFVQPLNEITEFGSVLRKVQGELDRVEEVLTSESLPEPTTPQPITRPGEVVFDKVSFSYNPGVTVLDALDFTIPPRTMTALVGPSGSGKTTVSRLIARFYDVNRGSVKVGGHDVREQSTETLMSQLALVFQDVYLFDDSLMANIAAGNPEATQRQIFRAAELAGVTEIAARLPQGWDTRVGEAGTALSGGERQRVSIARAIVKNAPIVLLDEATAALDPQNEVFFRRSCVELQKDSTLLVIAHKLSTVVRADTILVLNEEGQIAERGKHEELLALGGRYAQFWEERSKASSWRMAVT